MDHRKGQWIFAAVVGVLVAVSAWRWASDPAPRIERAKQEAVVMATRERLGQALGLGELELVDPLAPDRRVGKSYVYRSGEGWEVSGFYRRGKGDRWHPYLMTLDASQAMSHLKIQDGALLDLGAANPAIEVLPGATRTH
jgi:hypothetical protein